MCCPQWFGVALKHDVLDARLIVELLIIQCGDEDVGHKRLFIGPLREPIQCKSSINGRRQMSRVPFQDATYLKENYALCSALSRRWFVWLPVLMSILFNTQYVIVSIMVVCCQLTFF